MRLLFELFITYFKIGCFTFGGGIAMLPLIREEVVSVKEWMTDEEIIDCFAICQSLPGVVAINTAIYIGYKMKKLRGAIACSLGAIIPAFVSILIVLLFLNNFQDNIYVKGALEGIKAASVGLIMATTYGMGKLILKDKWTIAIAIVSFVMVVVFGVNVIWMILLGGLIGFLLYKFRKTDESIENNEKKDMSPEKEKEAE